LHALCELCEPTVETHTYDQVNDTTASYSVQTVFVRHNLPASPINQRMLPVASMANHCILAYSNKADASMVCMQSVIMAHRVMLFMRFLSNIVQHRQNCSPSCQDSELKTVSSKGLEAPASVPTHLRQQLTRRTVPGISTTQTPPTTSHTTSQMLSAVLPRALAMSQSPN